jgi:elongation factor G
MFGVDCHTGDTFNSVGVNYGMTSMFVPEPVISYSVKPAKSQHMANFAKARRLLHCGYTDPWVTSPSLRVRAVVQAINRFTKEDPTFRSFVDQESGETIISGGCAATSHRVVTATPLMRVSCYHCAGMGELHLDIYVERMKREYSVEVVVGEPKVNYRETITTRGDFAYLHKKQSGGAGQFARVIGYMEPLPEDAKVRPRPRSSLRSQVRVREFACHGGAHTNVWPAQDNFIFENGILGNAIPPEYISACKKGFEEALHKGSLIGHPVQGVKVVLTDGQVRERDAPQTRTHTLSRARACVCVNVCVSCLPC